jgi:hypothetical protein
MCLYAFWCNCTYEYRLLIVHIVIYFSQLNNYSQLTYRRDFSFFRRLSCCWVLAPCGLADKCRRFGQTIFRSYIRPLLLCLVTWAPEDGDSIFLRNVGIDPQIHAAPKIQDFDNNYNYVQLVALIPNAIRYYNTLLLRTGLWSSEALRHVKFKRPQNFKYVGCMQYLLFCQKWTLKICTELMQMKALYKH